MLYRIDKPTSGTQEHAPEFKGFLGLTDGLDIGELLRMMEHCCWVGGEGGTYIPLGA